MTLLYVDYGARLVKRKITSLFMEGYGKAIDALTPKRGEKRKVAASGKEATRSEKSARNELRISMSRIREAVNKYFPPKHPARTLFHVGDDGTHSTRKLLQIAEDMVAAWEKYGAELLANTDLIQEDLDEVVANAALLESADTTQESTRSDKSTKATKLLHAALDTAEEMADKFHDAVGKEYLREPDVLKLLAEAKKRRYEPTPDDGNDENPTPTQETK